MLSVNNFCLVFSIVLFQLAECYKEIPSLDGKTLPKAATFHFPEYAYKETSKNEITYHELEVACEQHAKCVNMNPVGVSKINCIRRCISPSCYHDIYAFNEVSSRDLNIYVAKWIQCLIYVIFVL